MDAMQGKMQRTAQMLLTRSHNGQVRWTQTRLGRDNYLAGFGEFTISIEKSPHEYCLTIMAESGPSSHWSEARSTSAEPITEGPFCQDLAALYQSAQDYCAERTVDRALEELERLEQEGPDNGGSPETKEAKDLNPPKKPRGWNILGSMFS